MAILVGADHRWCYRGVNCALAANGSRSRLKGIGYEFGRDLPRRNFNRRQPMSGRLFAKSKDCQGSKDGSLQAAQSDSAQTRNVGRRPAYTKGLEAVVPLVKTLVEKPRTGMITCARKVPSRQTMFEL